VSGPVPVATRGLRRVSTTTRLLRLRVRISWISVFFLFVCVYQVETSTTGRSLVQSSPTECGVSRYDREAKIMKRLWPTGGGVGVMPGEEK